MIIKRFFMALVFSIFTITGLSGEEENMAKGLNVALTAFDTQTQMMAMVLSMKTLEQGKNVNIVLCSEAGNLALKDSKSEVQKPLSKSPKELLQGIIKKGGDVKVCPLYLPNKNLDKSALIDGVDIANPADVATTLLNKDYKNLSY